VLSSIIWTVAIFLGLILVLVVFDLFVEYLLIPIISGIVGAVILFIGILLVPKGGPLGGIGILLVLIGAGIIIFGVYIFIDSIKYR
jgi:hypothetical protein